MGRVWHYQLTFQESQKYEVLRRGEMSGHNSHTSVNVCMHDIKLYCIFSNNGYLCECVYVCWILIYIFVYVHSIQSICVSHCMVLRALMIYCLV